MSSRSSARRFARVIWGDPIERSLVPVLAVTLLSMVAFAALTSYVGIWAVTQLHASSAAVGAMYACNAIAAALGGYFGGRLSDRLGRRLVITLGWGGQALAGLTLSAVGGRVYVGFVLVVLAGAASGPGLAATSAIVADLVTESRQEAAYATVRVVNNLGFMTGPPLGALALIGGHWVRFFVAVGALSLAAAVVALVSIAEPATAGAAEDRADGTERASRLILADRPFLLLLLSTFLGFVVYVAYEVVLPIAVVSSFGLAPAMWGLLVVINPVAVTLAQLRITRAVQPIPAAVRLAASLTLMGACFLLLLLDHSVPMIAGVVTLFVIGEMIWAPTSQALAVSLSPARVRGAYMGAFGASMSAAWAIGPLVALHLLDVDGPDAAWLFFAAAGAAAGSASAVACRLAGRRRPVAVAAPDSSATDAPAPATAVNR